MKFFLQVLRENKVASGWILLFMIMPVLSSSLLTWSTYLYEDSMKAWPLEGWVLIYVLAAIGMGLAIVPTTLIAMIGGYLFGLYSLLPMVMAYLGAVGISYLLAKWVDGGGILESLLKEPQLKPYVLNIHESPIKTVFYAKLSPLLPFGVSNLLLAFLGVRLPSFLFGSFLGMLPRTILATWAGSQSKAIAHEMMRGTYSTGDLLMIASLMMISIVGLYRIIKN